MGRGDVEFVQTLAAEGTTRGVCHRELVLAVHLAPGVIADHPPASAVCAPYKSFAIHRQPIRYPAIGRSLHECPPIGDSSGCGHIVVGVNAVAKRIGKIHDFSVWTPADAVGHGNVRIHQLVRAVALNTEQLTVRPFGIGIIQRSHPKPAFEIGGRIVKTMPRSSRKRIAEWLKRSTLGVPSRNSLGGSSNEPSRLPNPQRHDWYASFKHIELPRLRGEPENLIIADEIHPVKESLT